MTLCPICGQEVADDKLCARGHPRIEVHGQTYVHANYRANIIVEPSHPTLVAQAKRTGRIGNENSEDALTWNVFRSIEWLGLTGPVVGELFGLGEEVTIYCWMYPRSEPLWSPYADAWRALEPGPRRRHSEPDLVLVDEAHRRFVTLEPKFGSPVAESRGPDWLVAKEYDQHRRTMIRRGYALGDPGSQLLKSWEDSMRRGFYQLTRQMLFGNYIAQQHGYKFHLYSLISPGTNPDNEGLCRTFESLLTTARREHYGWLTWRQVYDAIVANADRIPADRQTHLGILGCYLRDKTFNCAPAHLLDLEDTGKGQG